MNTKADSTNIIQFLEAYLLVNRIRPNPAYLIAHNTVISKRGLARYNLTRVELKTFTYFGGPKYLSIDNVVLGLLIKGCYSRWLKTKISKAPWIRVRTFSTISISVVVHCSTTVNRTLATVCLWTWLTKKLRLWFIDPCLRVPAYIIPRLDCKNLTIYIYFMLLFDLTADRDVSEGHTSLHEHGNMRLKIQFNTPFHRAITCFLYLENENSVRVVQLRTVSTEF